MAAALVQAVKDFGEDNGPQWAAAVAYYSLLSVFPLLIAAVAISAYFVDPDWVTQQVTQSLGTFLPTGEEQVQEIVQSAIGSRATAGLVSILGLLWTGTRVFGAITKALNIAYDVDEQYGFLKRLLVELLMLLTVGVLLLLAIIGPSLLTIVRSLTGFLPEQDAIFSVLRWALPGLVLSLGLFLLYRFVPRRTVDWKSALFGAIIASALILIAQPLFLYYVSRFGDYNIIYGSLGIAVILIFWAYVVGVILLLGGEAASHYEEMVEQGRSAEDVGKRHRERSPAHRGE